MRAIALTVLLVPLCTQAKHKVTMRRGESVDVSKFCAGKTDGSVEAAAATRDALQHALGQSVEIGVGMIEGIRVLKARTQDDAALTFVPATCRGFKVDAHNVNKKSK